MTNPDYLADLLADDRDLDIDYDTPANMPEGEAEARNQAMWHAKMAAMFTAELEQFSKAAKAELERIELRIEDRKRILRNQIAWHEEPIESLHTALIRDNPDQPQTMDLVYGKSKVTVPKTPKVAITDKDAVLAWAEKNRPEILGHTINVTGVRSIARIVQPELVKPDSTGPVVDSETGEVIPGVRAELDAPTWKGSY